MISNRGDQDKMKRMSYGYAVFKLNCGCGKINLSTNKKGRYVCKSCRGIITYGPDSEVFSDKVELIYDEVSKIPALQESSNGSEIEILRTENVTLLKKIEELESEIATQKVSARQRDADFTKTLEERERYIEELHKDINTRERQLRRTEAELRDVDETRRSIQKEMIGIKSVDVRSITIDFLDFVTKVNNNIIDADNLDNAKETVRMLIDRLILSLNGHGVEISRHANGDDVADVRIKDPMFEDTDDSSLDMKVMRSNMFGCRFKDGVYADIPEELTVYRFNQKDDEQGFDVERRRVFDVD